MNTKPAIPVTFVHNVNGKDCVVRGELTGESRVENGKAIYGIRWHHPTMKCNMLSFVHHSCIMATGD